MLRFFKLLPLFIFGCIHAQEEAVKSVYFEFDKYSLDEKQKPIIDSCEFLKWVRAKRVVLPGLVKRRKEESDLYKTQK